MLAWYSYMITPGQMLQFLRYWQYRKIRGLLAYRRKQVLGGRSVVLLVARGVSSFGFKGLS